MKWIDIPPVWLGLAAVCVWMVGRVQPMALRFGGPFTDLLGGLAVGAGIVLMLLAAVEMRRHRTTIVPHRDADRLVTTGIFGRTRNPIYLGDLMVLAGLCLRWDAPVGLVLVALLMATLQQRFIIPEEDRLRRKFHAEFARYCQKTPRWL
ncbi:methyltransferase family protein [Yoonia tamlensis]|nr:isoprenylcysteine carboxylmethyltransferase family protein [Yoonia tamlensis]